MKPWEVYDFIGRWLSSSPKEKEELVSSFTWDYYKFRDIAKEYSWWVKSLETLEKKEKKVTVAFFCHPCYMENHSSCSRLPSCSCKCFNIEECFLYTE